MKKRLLSIALALSLVAPVCATPTAEAFSAGEVGERNILVLGGAQSGFVTKEGDLLMWGARARCYSGGESEGGDPEPRFDRIPTKFMSGVQSVALGTEYYAALKQDGTLWMWGDNSFDQLANKEKDFYEEPQQVLDKVAAISTGDRHSAVIKTDGSLWMWGEGYKGQLGDGTAKDRAEPIKVMENVSAVSVSAGHSVAIKTDGSLWAWGDNETGAIGDGTTTDRYTPVKVMENVAYAVAGWYYTAAIKEDGSLWMWGSNNCGKIKGTEEESDYYAKPVKVMENVLAVSLGIDHTAVVKQDGTLWMWGYNKYGQLGDGTTTTRNVPVKIMDNVASVVLGYDNSSAIKMDGSVWIWGRNKEHSLGLNRYAEYVAVPTRLFGLEAEVVPRCTITLNLNGGNGTTKLTCDKNGTITPPNNPSRDGYFFAGWYKDKACKKPWNFDTDKVTGNCTLYAKWEPKSTTTVTAEPSTQKVEIDGKKIVLNSYVLRNEKGYPVNFVKLRDIAYLLNGTEANFNVDWRNNAIRLDARQPYTTPNGAEMTVPTVAAAPAKTSLTPVLTGGVTAPLEAFLLTDKNGGGHNYFKLRDIGKVAGFNVEWDGARGIIVVTTTEDYIG